MSARIETWLMGIAVVASAGLTLRAETTPSSQPALEQEREWLVREFDKELHRVLAECPHPLDNAQGAVAWGHAYILEALAEGVEATHEASYAEHFVRVADDVVAARDDKHARRDEVRGKVLPAWGSVKYTDGKHYVWAVHTGMIVTPMAQFAAIVKRDERLRARFGKDADRLLQIAVESMAVHEDQYRDGPKPDEGYLYGEVVKSLLPLNQQLAPGRAYLWLYEATGEDRYRRRVERLIRFALNRIQRLPDGAMSWSYWPQLDGPGRGFEDTSHASITADFLAQCVEHKLAPAETLSAVEKTFLTRVLLSPDTVADDLSGQGANAFKYAPFLWGRLARHNPVIRQKMFEYIRNHPTGCDDGVFIEGQLVGYAHLLAATPQTPAASQPAPEADRAWLLRELDTLFDRVRVEIPPTADNAKGIIAWGAAYLLEALVEAVQATHDPACAEKFIRVAEDVIAVRDDKHGRRDVIRDKVLPAWGCVAYTEGKHYVWAVHTGMICAPMAQFATIVKRDDKLRARFGKNADRLLQVAAESMAVHEDQYRDGPKAGEGYLYGETLNNLLPLNQMLAPGRAYLWLYEATGEPRYRQRVERLVQFTLNRVRRMPDGTMIWCYWPPLDGPGEGLEDVSHAAIVADFLVQCVEHKLAPADVLSALEKTFLTRVLLGPEAVANYLTGGGVNAHRYAPCLWGRLARHNPTIRKNMIEHIRKYAPISDHNTCLIVGYAHLLAAASQAPVENRDTHLLGHWPLAGDCKDVSGNGNHGVNHGVNLLARDPDDDKSLAAMFDGRDNFIEVQPNASLNLAAKDFTISAWVHTERKLDDVLGDVLSMYDRTKRKGFNLSLMNYAGVTSGQSNYRNVSFGIDNARIEPTFTDCGRPGNNLFVCALTVHEGHLYAGTFETGQDESGHVWRYESGTQWTDCGSPDRSNSVFCLASHNGSLYAGTGRYLSKGSALPESLNTTPGGHVYRYEGPKKWADCGRLENPTTGAAVNLHSLAEYRGKLYASTLNREGFGLYEYAGDQKWKYCGNPGRRVETLTVYNGYLYTTSYDGGIACRYGPDGKWEDLPPIPDVTQLYGYIVYDGGLHVTTWPTGSVFRLGPDSKWIDRGRLGDQTEVMGISVYNGALYAGTLPLAQVYRYDGGTAWTHIGRLDHTPDMIYRRVWSMAVYQGRLYCGTLPSGHVYSIEAGKCATDDRALKPGWRLLAGVRRGNKLELYVDGELVATSSSLDPAAFDLSTDSPLRIGFGSHDYFRGRIRDVRLCAGALTPAALKSAAQQLGGRQSSRTLPFSSDFAQGSDGFAFQDDVFESGATGHAMGTWEKAEGGNGRVLRTRLQSAQDSTTPATSGGWSMPLLLAEPALVRIDVRFKARVGGNIAPKQIVDALLTMDGKPVGRNPSGSLLRIRPSELADPAPIDTGWQEASLDLHLLAGSHTVRLGLRADAGLAANTWAELLIDRVEIRSVSTVSFTGDGGFVIHSGGRDFASGSWLSRPGGGWHRVGAGTPAPGEVAPWQIQPSRRTESEWEGTAETNQFRLHRAIRVSGHRVRVEDTLTNLSDKDLGWMIRHELAVPSDPATAPAVHLGGDSRMDPSKAWAKVLTEGERTVGIDCWRPSNPTVYVPFPEAGVGLSIEDDVTRAHALTYWRRTAPSSLTVGFRDESFALPPGGQYTTRWAAYIIPGKDKTYYDFINQVRADWNLNKLQVPGPTVWSSFIFAMQKLSDQEIKTRLVRSGAWALATSLGGWIDPVRLKARTNPKEKVQVGFGPGVITPHFARLRVTWARDAERIHRLAPKVKVIHYFHTFLYDPQPDPDSFKDSWVTRRDGTRAITDWGELLLTPSAQVFPTLTNAVGRGMLQVLDAMVGPMNGNGIYFDEVNYPTGIGWIDFYPCTHNLWDGHSAVLDPKSFAIVQKCGYLELLSADFKKMLFERMASHDAIILGNGEPDTWWEDGLKFPRHTECRTDPYPRAYESHLYSPIALVEDRSFKHTREMLKYGVIDGFVRLEDPDLAPQEHIFKSFPLTAQQIHSGWLQARERIITMVPGVYSWHESARVKIYEFGADGRLANTREDASANGTFDIQIPKDGMVIAERIAHE